MKKAYFEKLQDPRWQKKRLEALEASNWACEVCYDHEETLHVHHKQYFKGREPWEYEVGQLAVLCKSCHEEGHEEDDPLLVAASFVPMDGPCSRNAVASLIAGYCGQEMTLLHEAMDPDLYVSGQLCEAVFPWFRGALTVPEKVRLIELAKYDTIGITEHLRAYIAAKDVA